MKLTAPLAGLGIAAAILVAPAANANPGDPPGANCETNFLGALYCDGPVQPNGTWTRCVDVAATYNTPPYHKCFTYDPANPGPTPIGQPDHHVGV